VSEGLVEAREESGSPGADSKSPEADGERNGRTREHMES